jgi:hypothetical protein
MLSFCGWEPESPVAVEESGFHLPGTLDRSWRSKMIRGMRELRPTALSGCSLTTRQMCGLPLLTATNENLNRKQEVDHPTSAFFSNRYQAWRPGIYGNIRPDCDIKRATMIENGKLMLEGKRRENGTDNGLPPAQI